MRALGCNSEAVRGATCLLVSRRGSLAEMEMTVLHTIKGGESPHTSDKHIIRNPATADELTCALANIERITSILRALLEERFVDHGTRRCFTITWQG
jgi:hypothetical protein